MLPPAHSARRVAVVEPDAKAAAFLERLLGGRGYAVSVYETPGRFFDALLGEVPEAVLLERRLPGMDGRDVVRVLRANAATRQACVVLLDGEPGAGRAAEGLDAGADEVLPKPLDPELLVARLSSLLRRAVQPEPPERWLSVEEVSIEPEGRQCRLRGAEVRLTRLEFDLLHCFVENRRRVLTRGALLQTVWRADPTIGARTVDKHVEALRRKLGAFGRKVETVFGVGYCLRA